MEDHYLTDDSNSAGSNKASSTSSSKEPSRQPFPIKVYAMLEDADSKNFSDIVAWNPPGNGFLVKDKNRFIQDIVPQYFNQTKYKSFQRQLSLYGFNRVTVGPNKGLRFHAQLRRGRYDLVCQMKPVGYKPRGTTAKILKEHQQQDQQPSAISSNSDVVVISVLGMNDSEGIPTVISSGSMDKLSTLSPGQAKAVLLQRQKNHSSLVSPGAMSEGEESSSEDLPPLDDEELQDLLERGLFEGMGFYLTVPTPQTLPDFLPAPALHFSTDPSLPPAGVMDAELKKAWETGYTVALAMKQESSSPEVDPLPHSPGMLMDECVDALDFHAANIAATTGAGLYSREDC